MVNLKRNKFSNWFKYRIKRSIYSKNLEKYWKEDGKYMLERETRGLFAKKREAESILTTSIIFEIKPTPKKILEFGCGYGRNLKLLEEKMGMDSEIYGLDISSTVLEKAKKYIHGKAKLLLTTDNSIPFPDKYFDVSFTSGVLNVNPPNEFEKICNELLRVTKFGIIHREQQIDYIIKWKHDYVKFYEKQGCKITSFIREDVDQEIKKFLDEDTIWWKISLPSK